MSLPRHQRHRRRYLLMVVAATLVASVAAPALGQAQVSQEPPEYEGGEVNPGVGLEGGGLTTDSQEVKYLAEIHGVSAAEALKIAEWMTEAELALIDVRRAFPDTYAGSEFIHENGLVRLDLWVASDGTSELSSLVGQLPKAVFASVDVKVAPLSEAELISQAESMFIGTSDISYGSLDFKTGRHVAEDDAVATTYRHDSHNDCTHGTGGGIEGGRLLRIQSTNNSHYDLSDACAVNYSHCTTGLTAKLDGYQGVLTAAHCLDDYPVGYRNLTEMYANGEELYVSLRVYKYGNINRSDVGFAREVYGSADPRGRMYLDQVHGFRDILALLPDPAPEGSIRCIKSAATADLGTPPNHYLGYSCGTVIESNFCVWVWLTPYCRYTKVLNTSWGDFPRAGSSGGPWFYNYSAAGTHSFSGTDTAVYYRLEWAKTTLPGLMIYCGGYQEYLCTWP